MRVTLVIFLSFGYLYVACQNDHIWRFDLIASHATGVIPSTGINFNQQTFTTIIKNDQSTFVPILSLKTIHEQNGLQLGGGFYQKINKGYLHFDLHYSPSILFPSLMTTVEINHNIIKNTSFQFGIRHALYHDGKRQVIFNVGPTLYLEKWIAVYHLMHSSSMKLGHKIMIRKTMNQPKDNLQLLFFNGVNLNQFENGTSLSTSSNSLELSITKSITKSTGFNIGLGAIFTTTDQNKNQYLNYSFGLRKSF